MVEAERGSQHTTQLHRGVVEYCVLALLRSGETYGFDIVRRLSAVDGMVTSEGTIYPLLTRLRKDGHIRSTWRESSSGPPRRYYRLTEEGERALAQFQRAWVRFRDGVDGVLEGRGA